MSETEKTCYKTSLKLKGGLYTLTTIQFLDTNLEALSHQLQEKIQQAPNFFKKAPVVLDFQFLSKETRLDLGAIKTLIEKNHLIPVAVRHGPEQLLSAAIEAGLPILRDKDIDHPRAKPFIQTKQAKKSLEIPDRTTLLPPEKATENPKAMFIPPATRVITEPVRSGQQIYARGSDLVITAAVSQGAEILADGHIHVYGPLRGRALAGISGNTKAYIFCSSLEAELVSISGQYKVSEDYEKKHWKKPVAISLIGEHLQIQAQ